MRCHVRLTAYTSARKLARNAHPLHIVSKALPRVIACNAGACSYEFAIAQRVTRSSKSKRAPEPTASDTVQRLRIQRPVKSGICKINLIA